MRQVLELRERTGARLPLVLMNSFARVTTRSTALERTRRCASDVPADFLQSKVPKLTADDLEPVRVAGRARRSSGRRPATATCTPRWSPRGCSTRCWTNGYRYAFVSNSDNLGAVLDAADPRVGRARARSRSLMEVADRTAADRKGGHLARRPDGGLVLREIAQTPDEDVEAFQDTTRHRYFNTNTLWVDLHALARRARARATACSACR